MENLRQYSRYNELVVHSDESPSLKKCVDYCYFEEVMKKSQQLQQCSPSLLPENKCSEDEFDTLLSTLPEKLNQRLLPFQKEGIKFGIERNGRCMIADEVRKLIDL
ncbi:hypothetical protein chiPu_0009553 [Chiloscyllium punctatum]|uniref:Uncharacterized protein n=1 Tax=Chiloscyllium punctatum TaxID=137246 RepID=A0A401SL21_CHIPU|nr:hypothetical protein [Chiloscyllium punctatum]